jgi:putative FmdB family regulatory protein
MPIYAYKCEACGFSKDVLQKLSDEPLSECPNCASQTFQKQLTAAGFQLKGSGWYVTDFKQGKAPAAGAPDAKTDAKTEPGTSVEDAPGKTGTATPAGGDAAGAAKSGVAAPAPAPAAAAPSAAPAPAPARPSQS